MSELLANTLPVVALKEGLDWRKIALIKENSSFGRRNKANLRPIN